MIKGARPIYLHEPHIKGQRAICGLGAAGWPPLLYTVVGKSSVSRIMFVLYTFKEKIINKKTNRNIFKKIKGHKIGPMNI